MYIQTDQLSRMATCEKAGQSSNPRVSMLYTSEQFAKKENVVQDAADRRVQREVPSSPNKHQSGEEQKRADQQRMRTSQSQRDDGHPTETARRCSGDYSPDQQFVGETVENKISYSTVQDVSCQDKTRLRDVSTTKKQTI